MFKKAEKKSTFLKIALCGPSGSGKTFSALRMAKGIGGKIAVIDTENGSASLYADRFDFDVCEILPPFTVEKYISAVADAVRAGYAVIIIDSMTHAWSGTGGLLDVHDTATKANRSGNSFTAWKEVTPLQNQLVDSIIQAKCHVIATIRTKTAYEVVEDEKGKKKPVKIGMKPEQREGLEYEFTTVFDVSVHGHIATASKDRTGIFDGKNILIDESTGETFKTWLNVAPVDLLALKVECDSYTTKQDFIDLRKRLTDAGQYQQAQEVVRKAFNEFEEKIKAQSQDTTRGK